MGSLNAGRKVDGRACGRCNLEDSGEAQLSATGGGLSDGTSVCSSDDSQDGVPGTMATGPVVVVRGQVKLGVSKVSAPTVAGWIAKMDAGVDIVKYHLETQGVDVAKCRFLKLWWVSRPMSAPALELLNTSVANGQGLLVHQANMRIWWCPRVVKSLEKIALRLARRQARSSTSVAKSIALLEAYGFPATGAASLAATQR